MLTYRDRTWGECPGFAGDSDEFNYTGFIEKHYGRTQQFGNENGSHVVVYRRSSDEASSSLPSYLVDISDSDMWEFVAVERSQDFIDLLVYLAPLCTAYMLGEVLYDDGGELIRAAIGDRHAKRRIAEREAREEEARQQRAEERRARARQVLTSGSLMAKLQGLRGDEK